MCPIWGTNREHCSPRYTSEVQMRYSGIKGAVHMGGINWSPLLYMGCQWVLWGLMFWFGGLRELEAWHSRRSIFLYLSYFFFFFIYTQTVSTPLTPTPAQKVKSSTWDHLTCAHLRCTLNCPIHSNPSLTIKDVPQTHQTRSPQCP